MIAAAAPPTTDDRAGIALFREVLDDAGYEEARVRDALELGKLLDRRPWHVPAYVHLLVLAHVGPSLGSGGVRPCSTWWAPFSPIMVEVAMVLPLINFGMIDASITRRPSMPRTLSS